MNNKHLREFNIHVLGDCLSAMSVPPQGLDKLLDRISSGECLDLLRDLGLDSLGSMEFCIQLEIETGIVVTPEVLIRLKTTDKLLKNIKSC